MGHMDDGRASGGRLAAFFTPTGIALVGATDRSRWSVNTFENLRAFSPDLPVYCVHPRHERVHGRPAYPSLSALDGPVDLAYVMVPTDQVLPVLEEAAGLGIRHAVVLTSGFAEAGEAGSALQRRPGAPAAPGGPPVPGADRHRVRQPPARAAPPPAAQP